MVGQALVTLFATDTWFALAIARLSIALGRERADWVAVALHAPVAQIEAPHVLGTACTRYANVTAQTVALAHFAALLVDRVTIVPVEAFLALNARGVVETLVAGACSSVARIRISGVDVVRAFAWQAFTTWHSGVSIVARGTELAKVAQVTFGTIAAVHSVQSRVVLAGVGENGFWT